MNFYEATVKYEQKKNQDENNRRSLFAPKGDEYPRGFVRRAYESVNQDLGVRCDPKEAMSIFFYDAEAGKASAIFSLDLELSGLEDVISFVKNYLGGNYDTDEISVSDLHEITIARFHQLGGRGENNGLVQRFRYSEEKMGIDFRESRDYQIREELIAEEEVTLDEAIQKSKAFMADDTFVEELVRIYSDENEKKYYGNPVHYKITASNMDSAMEMARLLGQALKCNQRLEGSRIHRITEIGEGCYDEDDIRNVFEKAHGNIVILDLSGSDEAHGNYARSFERVIDYFDKLVCKNHLKTLCIFVENQNHPGFAAKLVAGLTDEIDVIELKEGSGNRDAAITYIENLAKQKNYELSRDEIEEVLPEKQIFTVGEVYGIYAKWFKNGLRNRIYKSYKYCNCMEAKKEDKSSEPYMELQKMVGLTEIKKVVDEIIDSARIQKLRSEMGMDSHKTSLHMVFTGNPGSAKTTVARLITQIFTKEGIIDSGNYVECGRADLVGRYVGWTAKTVKQKFREAKGGVLFIDEAYSLVDDSNSFGDEAINTIVQEMENHRDDVIVIFAGYPEKMKEFLAKNEGLRSRIAFHLDFPDYTAEELTEILKLMAEKKGYQMDSEIEKRCLGIFQQAVKLEEFGNGRYVRNLLEQAMMAQSSRIAREFRGTGTADKCMETGITDDSKKTGITNPCKKPVITREMLTILKAEDFEVNVCKQLEKEVKPSIGFAV